MIERGGHFVGVSSVAAFLAAPMGAAYCASKAGVEQLVRCLRIELAPFGASAGVVHFGMVETGVRAGVYDDPIMSRLIELIPSWIEKSLSPEQAVEAMLRDVERRAPRSVYPNRWRLAYALRGLVGPALDASLARNRKLHSLIRETWQQSADTETKL